MLIHYLVKFLTNCAISFSVFFCFYSNFLPVYYLLSMSQLLPYVTMNKDYHINQLLKAEVLMYDANKMLRRNGRIRLHIVR